MNGQARHGGSGTEREAKLPIPGTPGHDVTAEDRQEQLRQSSKAFFFPYDSAYDIQIALMQMVFKVIEEGSVGVFESPTGTGKSLSLICGTTTWLLHNEQRHEKLADVKNDDGADLPHWVREQAQQNKKSAANAKRDEFNERMRKTRLERQRRRNEAASKENEPGPSKRINSRPFVKHESDPSSIGFNGNGQFLLTNENDTANLTPGVQALMHEFVDSLQGVRSPHEEEFEVREQAFYGTRTHSQIKQFIGECRKSLLAKGFDVKLADGSPFLLRVIHIGSREHMCINPDVIDIGKRRGAEAMNEMCRELNGQKPKDEDEEEGKGNEVVNRKVRRCPYLQSGDAKESQLRTFRDHALAEISDIEDLKRIGKELHTCPYYGAKKAVKQAHIVAMPYNMVLNERSRKAFDINLRGNIVIIDEAHNLIDTILDSHSSAFTSDQVRLTREQVDMYYRSVRNKLKGENLVRVEVFRRTLEGLWNYCEARRKSHEWIAPDGLSERSDGSSTQPTASTQLSEGSREKICIDCISPSAMVKGMEFNTDSVNLTEFAAWLDTFDMAHKVSSYANDNHDKSDAAKQAREIRKSSTVRAVRAIQGFLACLGNSNVNGQVLVRTNLAKDGLVKLDYQLLNPADVFADIARDSRSVILAGGTMEPVSDFQIQLFPDLFGKVFETYSFPHIVPPDHLMPLVVCKGKNELAFDFEYKNRSKEPTLQNLIMTLQQLCNVVPHGMVVFLPSYKYLEKVRDYLKASPKIHAAIEKKKKILYEPQGNAAVEDVLKEYGNAIAAAGNGMGGALLFAVVGAKLSEGINFANELARAVVMVGMPYADITSRELKERMTYIDNLHRGRPGQKGSAGLEFYHNLCMKAVNQSMGRAIRHKGDYAALLFLDGRYDQPDKQKRLSLWIREQTKTCTDFSGCYRALALFFKERRKGLLETVKSSQ